jgi:PKD repeat protein
LEFNADFDYNVNGAMVQFTNTSQGEVIEYQWTMGDGNQYYWPSPTHTYSLNGTYDACLVITGYCGNDTTCKIINIGATALEKLKISTNFQIYPNPATGSLTVSSDFSLAIPVSIEVLNVFGKEFLRIENQLLNKSFDLNLENIPPGVYFLRLSNNEFSASRRFTILR